MYAVIMTGGKQYRVTSGEKLRVETIVAQPGATVTLDKVLMIGNGSDCEVGTPYVAGGTVRATVVQHGRGPKIKIVKFRRRKHYQKVTGHRQNFTELQIGEISSAANPAAQPVIPEEIPADVAEISNEIKEI